MFELKTTTECKLTSFTGRTQVGLNVGIEPPRSGRLE